MNVKMPFQDAGQHRHHPTKAAASLLATASKWLLGLLLLAYCGLFAQHATAQTVTLKMDNVPVQKVLKEISRQTNVSMVYSESMFKNLAPVSIDVKNASISTVLDKCLQGQPFSYTINGNSITIKKTTAQKVEKENAPWPGMGGIKGYVKDEDGQPLEGATVVIDAGTKQGAYANAKGDFVFTAIPNGKYTIMASRVGYDKKEATVQVKNDTVSITVVLKLSSSSTGEAVVNGIFSRPKENFTGASSSFTGEQLREISNTSLITALRSLDASFQAPDDNTYGSDPNRLPRIQVRGSNSIAQTDLTNEYGYISNPPLIIIDGFEATLQRLVDMDMNLIAKVTILKDAAATAIYGSKSANGVLVIETKQPKAGETQVNYSGNLTVNMPDLTSFNLMDARQKLNFEEVAALYKSPRVDLAFQRELDDKYNLVRHNVERGVNTYWLSQPLQTELNHVHSLTISSGTKSFVYQANLLYNQNGGVMKGSKRDNLAGNLNVKYTYKNFKLQYQFLIGTTNSTNSPYGDFSRYATLNPYWLARDANGKVLKYVDTYPYDDVNGIPPGLVGSSYTPKVINPLYNASLNTLDETSLLNIGQNIWGELNIGRGLKINGTLSVANSTSESNQFLPASASDFFGITDFSRRGYYNRNYGKLRSTQASLNINYGRTFGYHTIFFTGGSNIQQNSNQSLSTRVTGFPSDRLNDLLLGLQYGSSKPSGDYGINRTVGFYGNTSYAFDNRYLLDVSYRTDGSSVFGANKQFGNFLSVGGGWNLHKEKMFRLPSYINQLKLRGSYGLTGSVNFPAYAAITTYNYTITGRYLNYVPATVIAPGNPDLLWQRTKKMNLGADLGLFKDRVTVNFNYYSEVTDDLIMTNETAPSIGFNSFYNNLGKSQNRGYEVALSTYILKNPNKKLYWHVGASWFKNDNKLLKIADVLTAQNKAALDTSVNPLQKAVIQYAEGRSVTTLYAVKSLGIDPSNGYEIFQTKDGKQTYVWDPRDLVPVGDLQPKFNITFTNNFQYKWFKLNFGLNVVLGGVQYNSTIADKIENANPANNVDARALEGRWQNPGDIAKYKGLTDLNGFPRILAPTNATSRFVKKNNAVTLTGLSLDPGALLTRYITKYTNIMVNKLNGKVKDVVKTDMLDIKFYFNNVFTFSGLKKERGTSYPFNRTYSLNLTLHL